MKTPGAIFLAVTLAAAVPADAGVIAEHAPNYVLISVTADTAFVGGVIDLGPSGSDGATAAPPFEPHPPYRDVVTASSLLLPFATSNPDKDRANGTVRLSFAAGATGVADSFSVLFSGDASALSALASDGSAAQAKVALRGNVAFYLDTFAAPAGSLVGSLAIAALPAAPSAYESYTVNVVRDGSTSVAFFSAGDAGAAVPLLAGHGYTIDAKYNMLVPHGVDPPIHVSMQFDVIPSIPEPGIAALMACGLALVGAAARRRRC